jgi:hypothetical protein
LTDLVLPLGDAGRETLGREWQAAGRARGNIIGAAKEGTTLARGTRFVV